jgi:hypothetical protein
MSGQESLGIARNVLAGRLHWLVSQDILEPVPVRLAAGPLRIPADRQGRDLFLTLTALRQGG